MKEEHKQRTRGRPKTFDREKTLVVAIDSYWREGVEEVSVNEICRRAGISKPGLYREFGNEDLLMDAVLTRYGDTVLASVLGMLSSDCPFQETLECLIALITSESESATPAGCLCAKMTGSQGRLGPVTRKHVQRIREQTVAAYSDWLERSVARGEIVLPVSLEIAATYLYAQITLLLTRMAASENREMIRAHATLAFAPLTCARVVDA